MTNALLNILIRTMPSRSLRMTLDSINKQTYKNVHLHIYQDNTVTKFPYHYNLFCNELKDRVSDGWFFFLDDDDVLNSPTALADIAPHLTENEALICQMTRGNGRIKPKTRTIISGKIGMPCLILHHSHKHIADVPAEDNGDYLWIKSVCSQIPYKFVEKILVYSQKRNYGQ